jgi:LacI family transcriptional regulator
MNGKGTVADATRLRVREVANRLGYAPSRPARSLAHGRTGNLGFILREDHFRRSESFYTRVFLGAEFEARQHKVYVLLATIPAAYDPQRDAPRFLDEHSVDGVLVAGGVAPEFLATLDERRIPYVLADYAWRDAPAVTIDNEGGAASVAHHFVERGHTDVAYLGADPGHPSPRARCDAFGRAMAAAGYPVPDERIVLAEGPLGRAIGAQLAARLLDVPPAERPTAVFCANDAVALGLIDAARDRGLAIPADLAVAGFDDVEAAAISNPPLTTVRVFKEQLGEVALRLLIERLGVPPSAAQYERGAAVTRISTELVVRSST